VRLVSDDPAAKAGLRRAFFDEGLIRAKAGYDDVLGDHFLAPAKLRDYFNGNRDLFLKSGLYSVEELGRVDKIIRIAELVQVQAMPQFGKAMTNAELQVTTAYQIVGQIVGARIGRIFGTIQSAGMGARVGRGVGGFISEKLGGGKLVALLEESLVDPEVARDLLMKVNEATEQMIIRRLRSYLANLGPVALGTRAEDEQQSQPRGGPDPMSGLQSMRRYGTPRPPLQQQ